MITHLPKTDKEHFCDVCVTSKQCRQPLTGTRVRASRALQHIHSDVCGPISPVSWNGCRYYVSFMDDYTHFALVSPIKNKSEVFERFKDYEALAAVQIGNKISKLTVGREVENTNLLI